MKSFRSVVALVCAVLLCASPSFAQVAGEELGGKDASAYYSASAYYPGGYAQDRTASILTGAVPGLVGAAAGGLLGYRLGGMMGAVVGGLGGFLAGQFVSSAVGGGSSYSSYGSSASEIYPYGSEVYSQYGVDPSALPHDDTSFPPLAPSTPSGLEANSDRRARFMKRFDRNGNGQMEADELETARAERLRRLDTDGDGAISENEKLAFFESRRAHIGAISDPGLKEARDAVRQAFTAYLSALKAGGAGESERAAFVAAREAFKSRMQASLGGTAGGTPPAAP